MDGLTLTPRIFKENNSLISWSTAFVILIRNGIHSCHNSSYQTSSETILSHTARSQKFWQLYLARYSFAADGSPMISLVANFEKYLVFRVPCKDRILKQGWRKVRILDNKNTRRVRRFDISHNLGSFHGNKN